MRIKKLALRVINLLAACAGVLAATAIAWLLVDAVHGSTFDARITSWFSGLTQYASRLLAMDSMISMIGVPLAVLGIGVMAAVLIHRNSIR